MRDAYTRRLYEAFAPLDPDERLPRELVLEGRRHRRWGRRDVAGLIWLPLLFGFWTLAGWLGWHGLTVLAASGLLFGIVLIFARSDR